MSATDKERIRAHIEQNYKPYEVFEKWDVMAHFGFIHGKEKIAQPTTERRLREMCEEGFLQHPLPDLYDRMMDKYYYEETHEQAPVSKAV